MRPLHLLFQLFHSHISPREPFDRLLRREKRTSSQTLSNMRRNMPWGYIPGRWRSRCLTHILNSSTINHQPSTWVDVSWAQFDLCYVSISWTESYWNRSLALVKPFVSAWIHKFKHVDNRLSAQQPGNGMQTRWPFLGARQLWCNSDELHDSTLRCLIGKRQTFVATEQKRRPRRKFLAFRNFLGHALDTFESGMTNKSRGLFGLIDRKQNVQQGERHASRIQQFCCLWSKMKIAARTTCLLHVIFGVPSNKLGAHTRRIAATILLLLQYIGDAACIFSWQWWPFRCGMRLD